VEFDVDKVSPVEWNDEAFKNLVLPTSRKNLLQSLVESHHRGIGFDDFIKGKGHGLVVNLYGPPGVGKLSFLLAGRKKTKYEGLYDKVKHSLQRRQASM
jgi:hypothetical protein